jgi:general secretion pathway protein M
MTALSPPVRRILALAILALVIVLPYQLAIRPVIDRFAAVDGDIAEQQGLLERYGKLAAQLDTLRSRLESIKRYGGHADDYLSGSSEAIVGADLQNRLNKLVTDAGGKLTSSQVLPSTEEGGFHELTVRVRLTTEIDGLRRILYQLETERPLLFVDNIDISSRQDRRRAGETDADPSLQVAFDVYGFLRPTP